MNPIDFELMLNFIARECALSEESFKNFKRLGVNPIEWPPIQSRMPLIEFFSTAEVLGYLSAQGSHGRHFLGLKNERYEIAQIRVHYRHQINILKAKEIARRLDNAPGDLEKIIAEVNIGRATGVQLRTVFDNYDAIIERHINKAKSGESLIILPKFPKLSKAIGGFNGERVTIISATSGFGKTKLAVNLADSAVEIMPTIFYNMEMMFEEFVHLFMQKRARIKNEYWASGSFITNDNLKALNEAKTDSLKQLKISDGKTISVSDLIASIYVEAETTPHFIIVDYDQKVMIERNREEWQGILNLVVSLEDAAKATNSHVILLAQANDIGAVKASGRAQQPASNLLNFKRDEDGRTIIHGLKTRFAKPFILEVDYDPAISQVTELDFLSTQKPKAPAKVERFQR
jgi:hypothetical protein